MSFETFVWDTEMFRILREYSKSRSVFKSAQHIHDKGTRAQTINEYVAAVKEKILENKTETTFMGGIGYFFTLVMATKFGLDLSEIKTIQTEKLIVDAAIVGALLALGIYKTINYLVNEHHRKYVQKNLRELEKDKELCSMIEHYAI